MIAKNRLPLPVLIAGGGIGGLAAALSLAQSGIASIVLERRDSLEEAGAGIQIGPHGVKILRALGIADALAQHAGQPEAVVVRHGESGAELTRLPLGRWIEARHGAPYWTLHRADLHSALLMAARASDRIEIANGTACLNVQQTDADIVVGTTGGIGAHSSSFTGSFIGAALIGADGINSSVRKLLSHARERRPLHPPTPFPAARGGGDLGPIQRQPRLSATSAGRATIRYAAPCAATEPVVTLWLSRRSHVVHYPVRGGRELSVVAFARDKADWTAGPSETSADLVTRLGVTAPALTDTLAAAVHWDKWPVVGWNSPDYMPRGRAALLGDAAHPVRPYLAQGAVMALEDAISLARNVTGHGNEIQSALAAYSATRLNRVRRVALNSYLNGLTYHLPWPLSHARDRALRHLDGQRLVTAYDWLYGGDA